jgi:hypothetical protein
VWQEERLGELESVNFFRRLTMKGVFLSVVLSVVLVLSNANGAETKPNPKVQVVKPKAGQVLNGQIDVRLKLPVGLREPVYVGLGGPPWVKVEKVADSDEHRAQLDTCMVPNGDQNLIVKTTNKRADTAVGVKVKNPLKIYFADLHSHTGYSDGTLLPVVAHDYARNTSKLDIFSLTDHLEYVDDNEWLDTREVAWDANEDGEFVVIPGLEWTKKTGHMNIFDPKTRHWPVDTAGFYKAAAEAGVTCKFNHPGTGEKVHDGLAYSEIGDKAVQLMEVRRDDEEKAYIRALKLGWHIAPDGSDDTHGPNWGSKFAWSGILAPGLSKRNVLHALKNRHLYSTKDRNCLLTFTVNGAVMGDIIAYPVKDVTAVISVNDPDAEDMITRIELFQDGAVVQTDVPGSYNRQWSTSFDAAAGDHFYFVKVVQADGDMIWSAPVWLTVEK